MNIGFLAKQIFGILGSQIETQHVFNLSGVLIVLQHCHLQMENLDWIIMVVKKWSDDSRLNYTPIAYLKDYIKTKGLLAEQNYDLIEEADFFEHLEVDDD